VKGSAIFSHVTGTQEKILDTQTSFEHLFQRPNAPEVSIDAPRTSLTGTGGTFYVGKSGGKSGDKAQVLNFDTGVTLRSPELELNDLGFMQTANEINHFTWIGLRYPKSLGAFRNARINYNHYSKWDYSGLFMFQLFNVNAQNNWQMGGSFGPWMYVGSDRRKNIQVNAQGSYFIGTKNVVHYSNLNVTIQAQPMDAMSVSLSAGYNHQDREQDQFASQVDFQEQTKIIVSGINRNTWRYYIASKL